MRLLKRRSLLGMPRYRVAFDGEWQETFDFEDEAMEWAREVGETGRLVWVIEKRRLRREKLLAVFPDERADEGRLLWNNRVGFGGNGGGVGAGGF